VIKLKAAILATAAVLPLAAQAATPTPPVADGSQPAPTMQFKLATDNSDGYATQWISAEGPITKRTPEDFKAFTKQYHDVLPEHPPTVTGLVLLDSPGGNLYAGLQLGRLFREGNFATMVGTTVFPEGSSAGHAEPRQDPGICASACAYAFLGGSVRLTRTSALGFHQFSFALPKDSAISTADEVSEAQATVGVLVLYLKTMGIDPEVLALASETAPSTISAPDAATMRRLKITTLDWE
jgi:hypothetical protein